MHTGTFDVETATSVRSDAIEYDLRTGLMRLSRDRQNPIKFHLIDNFVFQLGKKPNHGLKHCVSNYTDVAADARIRFVLPASCRSHFQTALLIDAHTWFPFVKFSFDKTRENASRALSQALTIRDLTSSCFADIADRTVHYAHDNRTCSVRVVYAYETTSAFLVSLQVNAPQSAWTHAKKLSASGHRLILIISFSPRTMVTLRLTFTCPLTFSGSTFERDDASQRFTMVLAKDAAELMSLVTFTRESKKKLFDSATAKRWPPPRLANGSVLDPRLDLPAQMIIGTYDSKTMLLYDELTDMFTFSEIQLLKRQADVQFSRDADFDLRESIKMMILYAFCGRHRFVIYTTKALKPTSPADFRTYCDILFLFEGIFEYDNRPLLALSYVDMADIEDCKASGMTVLLRSLIQTEFQRQLGDIAQARQRPHSLPSDSTMYDIKASPDELGLMRKLLKQNSARTKGLHRHGLIGPWHASFIECLRVDSRSLLLGTKLTDDCGINLQNEVSDQFGCHTCKKFPSDPTSPWSKCSRCKRVCYCSTACQTKDWPAHRNACHSSNASSDT